MQKEVIIIPNKKDLSVYKKYNLNTFLLPLKDYSIGYNVYFDIDEVNEISKSNNVYVILNKFLHMKIYDFDIKKFNDNIKFIVEDIGLINLIPHDRVVLYENHILSNYKAINYLSSLGINNVVINNDLTIKELKEIISNSNSNIYYFYTGKNNLMYSRRKLVSNFDKYFNLDHNSNSYVLKEKVSKSTLEIYEEDGSVVKNNKIFCASKYLNDLRSFNLIYDFSYIDELNEKMILENMDNPSLCNLIDSDYYFLENEIKYKVGDIK